MIYILLILVIYLFIDHFYRFRRLRSVLIYLDLSKALVDRTLIKKGLVTKEELETAEKEILGEMPYDEYLRAQKSLKKINIHIKYE